MFQAPNSRETGIAIFLSDNPHEVSPPLQKGNNS